MVGCLYVHLYPHIWSVCRWYKSIWQCARVVWEYIFGNENDGQAALTMTTQWVHMLGSCALADEVEKTDQHAILLRRPEKCTYMHIRSLPLEYSWLCVCVGLCLVFVHGYVARNEARAPWPLVGWFFHHFHTPQTTRIHTHAQVPTYFAPIIYVHHSFAGMRSSNANICN